ncbi:MAG TPA: endolytic transglycosylase MltG, partial [Acidobacteriaceae bacterium]|nr:endolytic transglycosylase MltG [Acidobacteriaceae bacterium]
MRAFLVFVLVLILATAGAYFLLILPFGPSTRTLVTIAPGTSVNGIAWALQKNGIIRNRFAFDLVARVERHTLKAGVYRFDHPAPLLDVYQRIRMGDVYTIALTIPEGFNMFDVAAAMEKAGLGSRDVFLTAEEHDTGLIRDLDPKAQTLEGYLFPDTYKLAPNMTPDQILGEMVAHFRQEAQRLGLMQNIPATAILASLVERETPVGSDRPMVASVFKN